MSDGKVAAGLIVGSLAGGVLVALAKNRAALDEGKGDSSSEEGGQPVAEPIDVIQFGLDMIPRLDKIIDSLDKEFLSKPEKMCAILWLNFPNLCFPVPLAYALTLAPGATVTVAADVVPGFIEVLAGVAVSTVDVDFVLTLLEQIDNGRIIFQDPS